MFMSLCWCAVFKRELYTKNLHILIRLTVPLKSICAHINVPYVRLQRKICATLNALFELRCNLLIFLTLSAKFDAEMYVCAHRNQMRIFFKGRFKTKLIYRTNLFFPLKEIFLRRRGWMCGCKRAPNVQCVAWCVGS